MLVSPKKSEDRPVNGSIGGGAAWERIGIWQQTSSARIQKVILQKADTRSVDEFKLLAEGTIEVSSPVMAIKTDDESLRFLWTFLNRKGPRAVMPRGLRRKYCGFLLKVKLSLECQAIGVLGIVVR